MTDPGTLAPPPSCCLTIAGSDSGGGAGIQADLKAFRAHGVHGLSAITSITSQNTRGVTAVHAVPLAHIRSQIAAVFDDFPVGAVKTGMLGNAATVRLVASEMRRRDPPWLVVDPVMVATSGARLLDEAAIAAMRDELLPLADVLTPNVPEAEVLFGQSLRTQRDFDDAAAAFLQRGARGVLLKGGHAAGRNVVDRYYDARGMIVLQAPRLQREGHGTGCSLASAIAAELARGRTPRQAVRLAVPRVQRALADGYRPGGGPVHVLKY